MEKQKIPVLFLISAELFAFFATEIKYVKNETVETSP
ncbi:hypothetical protein EVA_04843 [gut metagenome]|uniref:Uncharacterized protein n=1 Tax=gut metagenome TaxID=749906 RepID=J9GVW1_9ZZZZ